jgi:hypothetical protein
MLERHTGSTQAQRTSYGDTQMPERTMGERSLNVRQSTWSTMVAQKHALQVVCKAYKYEAVAVSLSHSSNSDTRSLLTALLKLST